jgi:hypothetical protein
MARKEWEIMSSDWEPQEPSPDFVDHVMARVQKETAKSRVLRPAPVFWTRIVGAASLAAALGAVVALGPLGFAEKGAAAATKREEIHVGHRAVAVLEPGAQVSWEGDRVTQTSGEVFYRVEPRTLSHPFVVHTPEGDLEVKGTCFRVRLEKAEDPVNKRDVKVGAVGAALGAAVLVTVFEGKVTLSHAAEGVTLTAGESARANGAGVSRTRSSSDESKPEPLLLANANLTDSVREYKQRLEAIEQEKSAIEKQLKEAKTRLAVAANDGQAPPVRSEYDLSQDDWKELAKKGEVKARFPCPDPSSWDPSPAVLNALGLAPEDAIPIHDAMQQSADRVWAVVRPLCIQALDGNAKVADKLGPSVCQRFVLEAAGDHGDQGGLEEGNEATRRVADVRAGNLPMPADPKDLGLYGQMLYTMSGESKAVEQQLSQSLGPGAAHQLIFGAEGESAESCALNFEGGPHPAKTK